MSGDLKHPSKAIPKGTLSGLLFTFITYALVVLSMGSTITRDSMYKDLNIIQDVRSSFMTCELSNNLIICRSMSPVL